MAQQDVTKIKERLLHTIFSVANQPQEPCFPNNLKKMNPESAFTSAFENYVCTSANTKQWWGQSTKDLPVFALFSPLLNSFPYPPVPSTGMLGWDQ